MDEAPQVAEEAAAFVSSLDTWMRTAGVLPPPEVVAAAEGLRAKLPPAPSTPTVVPTSEVGDAESEDEEMLHGVKRGAAEAPSRAASEEGRDHRKRTPPPARREKAPRAASR